MPIPTTTCSVCNQTVNKAQTYAVGDGKRACRSHQGIQEIAKGLQEKTKQEQVKSRVRKPTMRREIESITTQLSPKCFCCDKEGMLAPEYYHKILVCGAEFELTYGRPVLPIPFTEEQAKDCKIAYAPLKDILCLFYIVFNETHKKVMSRPASQAAEMLGFFVSCPECCKKHDLKRYNAFEDSEGKMDIKNLWVVGHSIAEIVKKEAARNLQARN